MFRGQDRVDVNKVEIFGRYYTIKGIDDREYLDKLAAFVDSHMRQVASATGTVDTLKVAILAALTIADAHFRAQEQRDTAEGELERSIEALRDQIELTLSP
jgi:cell division protein ZapA